MKMKKAVVALAVGSVLAGGYLGFQHQLASRYVAITNDPLMIAFNSMPLIEMDFEKVTQEQFIADVPVMQAAQHSKSPEIPTYMLMMFAKKFALKDVYEQTALVAIQNLEGNGLLGAMDAFNTKLDKADGDEANDFELSEEVVAAIASCNQQIDASLDARMASSMPDVYFWWDTFKFGLGLPRLNCSGDA